MQTVYIVYSILFECLCQSKWHQPILLSGCKIHQSVQYLLLAAQLFTLMLVACLEGVPVALAAPAPGIVAQGAQEDGLPAQDHSHALHQPHLCQLCDVLHNSSAGCSSTAATVTATATATSEAMATAKAAAVTPYLAPEQPSITLGFSFDLRQKV